MQIGDRVEIAPWLDRWMMGDRFGEIKAFYTAKNGKPSARVKLDKSGKTFPMYLELLTHV